MYNCELRQKTLIVTIDGEIDDFAAGNMRSKIDYSLLRKEVKNIVFDLRELEFMDSAGIGLLMGRYRTVKAKNGECIVVIKNERVKKILKMSGILNLFQCYDDINAALTEVCEKVKIKA